MSCSNSNSIFLRRIVPVHRLGTSSRAPASKFVTFDDAPPIEFRTAPWTDAMCLLYRNLRKLHQHAFPADDPRKLLGDRFLRAEFRRAKVLQESQAVKFYASWVDYGVQIERGSARRGVAMSPEQEAKLNDEQKASLKALRTEAFRLRAAEGVADIPGAPKDQPQQHK